MDDTRENLRLLVGILEAHGYQVRPASSESWARNLALTLIRQQRFVYVPDAWSYLAAHAEEELL